MDIHPPKHPIKSVREFLFEIFTITCGILIALSLENLVQHSRDAHLRKQTRDDFLREISANRDVIQKRAAAEPADEASIKGLIEEATRRLAHQHGPAPQSLARDFSPLSSDAWQTALATQGIAQLNHATASVLSAAYDEQAAFNSLQERALNEWLSVAAFGDLHVASDESVQGALQHLRICYGLAVSFSHIFEMLGQDYAAAQDALRSSK